MATLKVTDGHKLHYTVKGNTHGLPVLYLHGGPGGGCSQAVQRFFDFRRNRVIFLDQRGAGKSRPFATTKNNTTDHLVEDINRLLDHLGLEKVFLFGGSWGSTLALVYAIRYPERVTGLLLRGIFLATHAENNFYLRGGMKQFFPDVWNRFISHVPTRHKTDPAIFYEKQMNSRVSEIRRAFAYEWAFYEYSIAKLCTTDKKTDAAIKGFPFEALSRLEAHYITRNCFLPDNYILENCSRIKHLPVSIVQGRYDMICPPSAAFELHSKLPKSVLRIETSGHSGGEKPIEARLISEMKRMTKSAGY